MDYIKRIEMGLQKPGKTQAGLAKMLGRDTSAATRILQGTRKLKASEIAVVASYLDVSPEWLLLGEGPQEPILSPRQMAEQSHTSPQKMSESAASAPPPPSMAAERIAELVVKEARKDVNPVTSRHVADTIRRMRAMIQNDENLGRLSDHAEYVIIARAMLGGDTK